MGDNAFIKWVNVNKTHIKEVDFCKQWDEILAEPKMQQAIASSRRAQRLFGFVESAVACDHTKLIDIQLKAAFVKLTREDFANPKGFAEKRKASKQLKNYFTTQQTLQHVIADDILQHDKRDSQLNAFRRWITVAEQLLTKHNYEAYVFVLTYLISINIDYKYYNELPEGLRTRFLEHNTRVSPAHNFSQLRQYMKEHQQPDNKDFLPLCLISKDITVLNEVNTIRTQKTKGQLLKQIMVSQQNNNRIENLPEYLQQKYQQAKRSPDLQDRFNNQSARRSSKATFYDRLMPSLWNRRCSKENYWEKMFSPPKAIP